ncbi:hypothetical protein Dsin_028390 [Dipteronia sinensis]|uniref:Uncharacterized protein n=1 Tax=Dipteronia sinensis TaxID=43782 RepID=A0AAE0DUJ1_9ROSI|nr:hypothetical protein Dsin_028390 [Dipteronia sinensis]
MSDGRDRVTKKVKWFSNQRVSVLLPQMTAARTTSFTSSPSDPMVLEASEKARRSSSSLNLMDLVPRSPMWP